MYHREFKWFEHLKRHSLKTKSCESYVNGKGNLWGVTRPIQVEKKLVMTVFTRKLSRNKLVKLSGLDSLINIDRKSEIHS